MSDRADPFEWSGGHPALDLVNTLDERPFDEPVENLAAYRSLVRFTELAGLVEPALAATLRTRSGTASSRVLERACQLREHLHAVFSAAHKRRPLSQNDLDAIAAAIQAAHAARGLGAPHRRSRQPPLVPSEGHRYSAARVRACRSKAC